HPPIELLDRADEAEVALLDQVEQGHAGLRVVPRDRHHEPKVRLDQTALRLLVALVLALRQRTFLGGGEKAAVADLPEVELQRILGRPGRVELVLRRRLRLRLVQGGNELEPRLVFGRLGGRTLVRHTPDIGIYRRRLNTKIPSTERAGPADLPRLLLS